MTDPAQDAIREQFGATIAMLRNAISACPPAVWLDETPMVPFWYLAFHTLFWLDVYLSPALESFRPPAPFTLQEFEPGDQRPPEPYSQEVLLRYLEYAREKCERTLQAWTPESAAAPAGFHWLAPASVLEVHIYNLRHVQHGAAQLNFMLREAGVVPPRWVQRASATTTRLPGA